MVDIFYDRNLVRENYPMPLNWERPSFFSERDNAPVVDFLQTAKDATDITGPVGSISVYVANSKPSTPIDWYNRTLYTHSYYNCEEVASMKDKYVAIGLSRIGFRCAICLKRAFFASRRHMETFCSQVCYESFLSVGHQ